MTDKSDMYYRNPRYHSSLFTNRETLNEMPKGRKLISTNERRLFRDPFNKGTWTQGPFSDIAAKARFKRDGVTYFKMWYSFKKPII